MVAAGVELRRDLDRWDRRAGLGPALALAFAHGTSDGVRGNLVSLAPSLRAYLLPNRLAVAAVPALVRVGTLAGETWAFDVGGQLAVSVELARLELSLESPPLSYVSRSRWYDRPLSVRLGLLFD